MRTIGKDSAAVTMLSMMLSLAPSWFARAARHREKAKEPV